MASLFTGQAVLVARFAGAGDSDRVNRVVQQAFITAIVMFAVRQQSDTSPRRRCSTS
jgi:Na+-driven multidrug efflux pump